MTKASKTVFDKGSLERSQPELQRRAVAFAVEQKVCDGNGNMLKDAMFDEIAEGCRRLLEDRLTLLEEEMTTLTFGEVMAVDANLDVVEIAILAAPSMMPLARASFSLCKGYDFI